MVGMYHDALQSGLKAFGFDRGVTVQGGLTVPVTTTAHGSAFAIAGKNEANLDPILNSFKIALSMSQNCLLYTSPSPRDYAASRMPSSA